MRNKTIHIACIIAAAVFLSFAVSVSSGNQSRSVERLFSAAAKGNSESMFYLGFMYKTGRGVEKDLKKAHYWYRRAAHLGNTEAMNCLAEMYQKGEGVERDTRKMIGWYERAAKAGDSNSMFYLAVIYDRGKGAERDFDKALYWYKQAANAGDSAARYWLENLKNRDEADKNEAEDVKKAVNTDETVKKNKKGKDDKVSSFMGVDLMYTLGSRYYDGLGISRNYEKAFEWFMKAAEAGSTEAMIRVSSMYLDGKGVGKDHKKAALWAQKAAIGGDSKGMEMLGKVFINGSYNIMGISSIAASAKAINARPE